MVLEVYILYLGQYNIVAPFSLLGSSVTFSGSMPNVVVMLYLEAFLLRLGFK